jgi:hypothetical protein
MRRPIAVLFHAAFAALALSAAQLMAAVIPPIGLSAGSQYQLVFVTADGRDATSSNIADYNTFVTNEAALNPLLPAATWNDVGSTATVDANVNASSGGLPVYNTAGQLVATAGTGLYTATLVNPILYDQFGTASPANTAVWTGSGSNGTDYNNPPLLGLGASIGATAIGDPTAISANWAHDGNHIQSAALPLYALSTAITVPTPEPATLTLLGSALLLQGGIGIFRRRRARR